MHNGCSNQSSYLKAFGLPFCSVKLNKGISSMVVLERNGLELEKVTIYCKIQENDIYRNTVNLINDLFNLINDQLRYKDPLLPCTGCALRIL